MYFLYSYLCTNMNRKWPKHTFCMVKNVLSSEKIILYGDFSYGISSKVHLNRKWISGQNIHFVWWIVNKYESKMFLAAKRSFYMEISVMGISSKVHLNRKRISGQNICFVCWIVYKLNRKEVIGWKSSLTSAGWEPAAAASAWLLDRVLRCDEELESPMSFFSSRPFLGILIVLICRENCFWNI